MTIGHDCRAQMPLASFPDFELPASSGVAFKFSEHRGHPLVLYFYPKNNTPGCTSEGQQFRDLYPQFEELQCPVFGISRDMIESHRKFKSKMGFPFELLSDVEEVACKLFDVIRIKDMYGRKVRGIERSTFVFDSDGNLHREWRRVKVPEHVQEVLSCVRNLKAIEAQAGRK
jgi:peroxiredoxin Q/BCP